MNVRLTPDEIRRIDEAAKADDRSRAYMVRKLILQSLDALQDTGSWPHEEDAE
ncbi:MAG: ribbon-helix-helix protein, CopG family [Synergistaceae bacterium]|nr:ribbon-helix-helix protein, CopG family [Synergistaceae bacterium]